MSNTSFEKQTSSDVTEYVPIAKVMHNLDAEAAMKVKRKFDITYLIAKNNLAFTKMAPLCEVEQGHEVDLGQDFKNYQLPGMCYLCRVLKLLLLPES